MSQGPSESGFHFMQAYRNCQKKFYYQYIVGLEDLKPSPAIIFGINMHMAMATWYQAYKDGLPLHERVIKAKEIFKVEHEKCRDSYIEPGLFESDLYDGSNMIEEYGLRYCDEVWTVRAIEEPVEYTFKSGMRVTGRIDLVATSKEARNYIIDHKTTRWAIASLIRELNKSDQASCYIHLWNSVHPELLVCGVVFNILRRGKTTSDFRQHLVLKSNDDVKNFVDSAEETLTEITNKVMRSGAIWTTNTDRCFDYNKACPFMDICPGDNYESLIGTAFKLKDHKEVTYHDQGREHTERRPIKEEDENVGVRSARRRRNLVRCYHAETLLYMCRSRSSRSRRSKKGRGVRRVRHL